VISISGTASGITVIDPVDMIINAALSGSSSGISTCAAIISTAVPDELLEIIGLNSMVVTVLSMNSSVVTLLLMNSAVDTERQMSSAVVTEIELNGQVTDLLNLKSRVK
jgi:hypothetical protein